jgi:GMP synthase-like glutamine amidotransferase
MRGHLAVLLTNTDTSAFAQRYPNDGEKVVEQLRRVRPAWPYRVYRACDGELPASTDALGGVVITGSPASVNDDAPWIEAACAFVRSLHARRVPTVGLCFGHQLIAKALGGTVERAADWGLGVGRVNLVRQEPWMQPPQAQLTLFAAHQDQVTQLPPGARLLGGDAFCPLGCYTVDGNGQGDHMLAIQYHPELGRDFMRALLDHLETELPAGVVARGRPQIEQPVDAALFFAWMARFIEGLA